MSGFTVPAERFRPIVERYVAEHGGREAACRALASATSLGADAWRMRLSDGQKRTSKRGRQVYVQHGWLSLDAVDEADVDEFLTAAGLTYLWWTELRDLLPDERAA